MLPPKLLSSRPEHEVTALGLEMPARFLPPPPSPRPSLNRSVVDPSLPTPPPQPLYRCLALGSINLELVVGWWRTVPQAIDALRLLSYGQG